MLISEFLKSLGGIEDSEDAEPKSRYEGHNKKTRRRNTRRRAMERATQTVRMRRSEKAVQTEEEKSPSTTPSTPGITISGSDVCLPTYVAALDSTLMRCLPKRHVEPDAMEEHETEGATHTHTHTHK